MRGNCPALTPNNTWPCVSTRLLELVKSREAEGKLPHWPKMDFLKPASSTTKKKGPHLQFLMLHPSHTPWKHIVPPALSLDCGPWKASSLTPQMFKKITHHHPRRKNGPIMSGLVNGCSHPVNHYIFIHKCTILPIHFIKIEKGPHPHLLLLSN